jgi:hypothetical protein
MTVGELRAALTGQSDDEWVVLLDPRLDRRLWLDHVTPGYAELVGVRR